MRRMTVAIAVSAFVCLWAGNLHALTFSVDQPPCGTAGVYVDGTLLQFSAPLDGTPDAVRSLLVGSPVDALHVGLPEIGLLQAQLDGGTKNILSWTWTGSLAFSLDDGDPFPIGVSPDRDQEIWVATPYGTANPAVGHNLGFIGDAALADEPNLGLGPNYAFDDDVDALDTQNPADLDQEILFFSIDDRYTLVPNLAADFRTLDIYARFTDGGIAKVIDGVTDLGLVHQGDGAGTRINDDIDAMILVDLDDCTATNFFREVTYNDPTGAPHTVMVDLGDAILFSLDNGSNPAYHDLPYQNAGTGPNHFEASMDTYQVYLSAYGGSSTAVLSHAQLGLATHDDTYYWDDIDALGVAPQGGAVPEPGTLLLIGTGLLTMVGVARRRRLRG